MAASAPLASILQVTRFSIFPNGARGAALLLLRISAAALLAVGFNRLELSAWVVAGLFVVGAALLAGLCTRLAAVICTILATAAFFRIGGTLNWLIGLQALNAAALAILGAGAYSIDARLFGRRVIEFRE
jgi:hypothetical protein